MNIYFSDYFEIDIDILDSYGALNISLINDLPLFIDPFQLFNSKKKEYQQLHHDILLYVGFLKCKSENGIVDHGLLSSWFCFPEVKQNWLGYSKSGNAGSGLGMEFARALNRNLHFVFANFGTENITKSSHLEKLCLIKEGVGRDNISDFTANLIKDFLLTYTERISKENIAPKHLREFKVPRVIFNYETESWECKKYVLPNFNNDFVVLTPKNILSRDSTWINREDLFNDFSQLSDALPNQALRAQINNYFLKRLPKEPTGEERKNAIEKTLEKFPILLDYFIKYKEDNGHKAEAISKYKVKESEKLFIKQLVQFIELLKSTTKFYELEYDSYQEAYNRIIFLKQVIENNDGYKYFYVNGKPVRKEEDLQRLFRLTWYATVFDVNSEVNNGRGPVDYKVSLGSFDKTLVEFKLASNTQLIRNLKKQVEIYKTANQTKNAYKVILYFTHDELSKVEKILKELKLENRKDIILIDAIKGKKSASKEK